MKASTISQLHSKEHTHADIGSTLSCHSLLNVNF